MVVFLLSYYFYYCYVPIDIAYVWCCVLLKCIAPIPSMSFSPPSPIQNHEIGDPLTIQCIVSTVTGVSTVNIIWTGPRGIPIMSNGRTMITNATNTNSNVFTGNLSFTYLMEGDEGTYTCNVMILETNRSESVKLQSLDSKIFFV